MSIYRSAVNKPVTTALIFVAAAVLGIFSLVKTSIALFPDIDANVVMVMSSYPGTSAADIETNVTKILENSLNGVSDLKEMTSQSKENTSIIMLEFRYGTDIETAINNVRDKLDMASQILPDGASTPIIMKFSMDDLPIMILSARADESVSGLDRILDDKVTTPLARVNGVGTISVTGAPTREIQVLCDPEKLHAYGLSIAQISQIIAAENRNVPGGSIDIGRETFNLRVEKEFSDPSELNNIIVGLNAGSVVYLKDVAEIIDGQAEREMEVYSDGIRCAQIIIQKQTGSNTVNVIKKINEQLKIIEPTLPSDIEIKTVIDSSDNIINTINSLKETILITFIVVMLVVFVFLGRWRATFIIVLSIPIALLASLMYLFVTGNTLNIISMSSLSIAIGMVVDDAIVVLENITTHLERGEKPKEAAVYGTSEVGISVIASTLTMLCVFLPLTMMTGMAGIMFKQLGWIVSIIMIVSTIAALTLIPMLCSKALSTKPKNGKLYKIFFSPINKALDGISSGYSKLINWAITHRKTVLFISLAAFIAVIAGIGPNIKSEYFPTQDQGRLTVNINLPVGTGQEVTKQFAEKFYNRIIKEIPEVVILTYNFGQADTDNAYASMQSNGTHIIAMNINLGSMELRERSCGVIADQIRKMLKEYPEVTKATVSEGMGGIGGASTVDIELYGYDFNVSDKLAYSIREQLMASDIFSQVTLSRDEYTPEYQLDFDRTKLAVNGLNSSTAASYLNAAMQGSIASFFREDGDEYNIRVRLNKENRKSIEDIENLIIYTPTGSAVKAKDLGDVIETQVPPTIHRKNRTRVLTIKAIVSQGKVLSDAVAQANKALEQVDIPPEFTAVVGGDYEDQQEMFGDMGLLMLLIILLVYMVMASQFESLMGPFVIMFSIPFAFVGVLIGLWVTGTALGMMAMVGIIILLGIVVKNGIVLIDYTILCQERGMSALEASVTAAKSRLRPILMTTLTTVLGMVPMAIGKGEGSEMWRSLGMTVCWGLSISTLVTLVFIPTLYCVFETRREKRKLKKKA